MQLSPSVSLILIFGIFANNLAPSGSQRISARQDRIEEWIRTIREAPKGHSLSPSWTSKARPQVIGVGALPLQNEAEAPGPLSPQRAPQSLARQPNPSNFNDLKFRSPSTRTKRYPVQQGNASLL